MGDGTKISFWHVQWCGAAALKVAFPPLYGLTSAKDASVADNLEILGGSNQWNVNVYASSLQVSQSVRTRRESGDQLWWIPSKRGLFKVISFYCSLVCSEGCCFPWKSVWQTQAPPRQAFFARSAALGKIHTLENLRKQHITVDHHLLHCDVASTIWSSLFNRFGMSWVMPRCVVDLYDR